MTPDLRHMLGQHGRRRLTGLEASFNCGGLQHKHDLIAAATDRVGTGVWVMVVVCVCVWGGGGGCPRWLFAAVEAVISCLIGTNIFASSG
jgi:hypothetical protein